MVQLPCQQQRKKGSNWIPLFVLCLAMAAFWALDLDSYLDLALLINRQNELSGYVAGNRAVTIILFTLLYMATVALSVPGASILTIAGGFLFGWFLGGLAALTGATVGATAVFLIARTSFGALLKRKAGPSLARLAEGFRENAVSYMLFLRLTPVFPFWLLNIAPALLGVKIRTYVWTTVLGIIPGTFAFSVIGAGLGSVIEAQEAANPGCSAAGACPVDFKALVTPQLLAAFFALGLAALIPILVRTWREGRGRAR